MHMQNDVIRLDRKALLEQGRIGCKTENREPGSMPASGEGLYVHELMEITLVCEGSGVYRTLTTAAPCKENDIFVIHTNIPHGFSCTEENSGLWLKRLYFDPNDWFDGEISDPAQPRYCYGVFQRNVTTAYARLDGQTRETIAALWDRITDEQKEKSAEWQAAARSNLILLMIAVARYINRAIKTAMEAPTKECHFASSVQAIVNERFGDSSLTLEYIADSLYLSKSYLSRLFKRATGKSYSEYLSHVRVENACRLLTETDMTVESIAQHCGLRDIPSFYRLIHAHTGVTPNQFRKAHKSGFAISRNADGKSKDILQEISENVQTGKAEYIKITPQDKSWRTLVASCSLPMIFPIAEIDGKKYLDGGIADAVPFERAIQKNCDKLIVILTREKGYIKKKGGEEKYTSRFFGKYPLFAQTLKNRSDMYNAQRKRLFALEEEKRAFVFCPKDTSLWKRTERDSTKIKKMYDEGYELGIQKIEELKQYLEK